MRLDILRRRRQSFEQDRAGVAVFAAVDMDQRQPHQEFRVPRRQSHRATGRLQCSVQPVRAAMDRAQFQVPMRHVAAPPDRVLQQFLSFLEPFQPRDDKAENGCRFRHVRGGDDVPARGLGLGQLAGIRQRLDVVQPPQQVSHAAPAVSWVPRVELLHTGSPPAALCFGETRRFGLPRRRAFADGATREGNPGESDHDRRRRDHHRDPGTRRRTRRRSDAVDL